MESGQNKDCGQVPRQGFLLTLNMPPLVCGLLRNNVVGSLSVRSICSLAFWSECPRMIGWISLIIDNTLQGC